MRYELMAAVKALIDLAGEGKLHAFETAWEFDAFDGSVNGEALFEELRVAYDKLANERCTTCGEERFSDSFCTRCGAPICAVCDGTREHDVICRVVPHEHDWAVVGNGPNLDGSSGNGGPTVWMGKWIEWCTGCTELRWYHPDAVTPQP